MSGGSHEPTAAYINNGHSGLIEYGGNLVNATTKYKDVYIKGNDDDEQLNYELNSNKKGDAIYETSASGYSINSSWYSDHSIMPHDGSPFFIRGGANYSGMGAGLFVFTSTGTIDYSATGGAAYYFSFRVVLNVASGI